MIRFFAMANVVFGFAAMTSAQKSPAGLYGECDSKFAGYFCSQVLLDTNGKFEYYDYLHMKGRKINKGQWTQKGDTLVFNSDQQPKIIGMRQNDSDDKYITIHVIDTTGFHSEFGSIYVNADTNAIEFDDAKSFNIPRQEVSRLLIRMHPQAFILNFTPDELAGFSDITIYIGASWSESMIFKDEKWLLKNNKSLHCREFAGGFNPNGYERTALKNKRF